MKSSVSCIFFSLKQVKTLQELIKFKWIETEMVILHFTLLFFDTWYNVTILVFYADKNKWYKIHDTLDYFIHAQNTERFKLCYMYILQREKHTTIITFIWHLSLQFGCYTMLNMDIFKRITIYRTHLIF